MPDHNNKHPKPGGKTLSNSLRLKSPNSVKSRQKVSNILEQLPFLRKLNETQNQLLSVTPIWQKWCSDQANPIITEFASPANIETGVLTINCKQSSTATILKHQQSSLLEALKSAGIGHVQTIRVQMSLNHHTAEASATPYRETESQSGSSPASRGTWSRPSDSSLKSIEATQALIKNEQLAASLKRLAETLKKAT